MKKIILYFWLIFICFDINADWFDLSNLDGGPNPTWMINSENEPNVYTGTFYIDENMNQMSYYTTNYWDGVTSGGLRWTRGGIDYWIVNGIWDANGSQFNHDILTFSNFAHYEVQTNQNILASWMSIHNYQISVINQQIDVYNRNIYVGTEQKPPDYGKFITTWSVNDNETITLPLRVGFNYDFTVEWGDGTSNHIVHADEYDISHQYTHAGIYTNKIEGLCEAWYFNNDGNKANFKSVEQWGSVGFTGHGLDGAFYGCQNITNFYSPIPYFSVTSLNSTWQESSGPLPEISNLVNVISLYATWKRCFSSDLPYVNSLTNITDLSYAWDYNFPWQPSWIYTVPEVYNLINVTNLEGTWSECEGLYHAPIISNLVKVTSLAGTWAGCKELEESPEIYTLTNVTTLAGTWYFDYSLTNDVNISTLINVTNLNSTWERAAYYGQEIKQLTNVTELINTWNYCYGYSIEGAPELPISVTNLAGTWAYTAIKNINVSSFTNVSHCSGTWSSSGLTNIDNLYVMTNLISTSGMFQNCTSLKETIPEIWNINIFPYITDHNQTFYNCTNLSNYGDIPSDWK